MQAPIPYSPSVETVAPDEAETIRELVETLRGIMEVTAADYGHAVRSVHAKSHGIIKGELEVLADLPPELAQGMFARPGRHSAILRISTNPGDILHDSISVPRGIALKVLDVDGERLEGAEGRTQDFVMVNGPAFSAKDAAAFLKSLKLLAKTTDRAEWAKKALSSVLRGTERVLEAVGGESSTLKTLGGAPNVHPLGETYYTQTPFRYGNHVAKLSLVPISKALTRHTKEIVDTRDRPDALRDAVDAAMLAGEGVWELQVQLCRDPEKMPIEDPTVLWDEDLSPFTPVARLTARPQHGWTEARAKQIDDGMRFSVWTGLEAHRPLGGINRARRAPYRASADYRAEINRCPIHEPASVNLPSS
ncbi:catalase family protein [Falsirhodobacter xinxiangensis]|uniref:catalase family protein n=1 Tax=Falsirhodobacter xinxiangensis TaxID=2530049 RepID=UPI0010AA0ECA|nr:catalase family protein [Rhodobacter xinxiangensis]